MQKSIVSNEHVLKLKLINVNLMKNNTLSCGMYKNYFKAMTTYKRAQHAETIHENRYFSPASLT
jgi:hypothetical protein